MRFRSDTISHVKRLLQIDVLKALAIVGVIVNHAMSPHSEHVSLASLHVMQAVPVFLLLIAFNAKRSLDRLPGRPSLLEIYRSDHVQRRLVRLLRPLLAVFAIGVVWALVQGAPLYFGPLSFAMRLPFMFPGNFFIPVSIAFAIGAPALYVAYRRMPGVTLLVCIAFSVAYELVAPFKFSQDLYFMYQVNPLRFAGLFGLGLWLADDSSPLSRRNWFMIPAGVLSAGFIVSTALGAWGDAIGPEYMYNVGAAGWPLLLTALGLTWLPEESGTRWVNAFANLGRASYQVFLIQGLWFGGVHPVLSGANYVWPLLSLVVCCAVGVTWWRLGCTRGQSRLVLGYADSATD